MKLKTLTSFSLLTLILFLGTALTFSLISPPVYGQTDNAWNIHKRGANDLDFYYRLGITNQAVALRLNANGEANIKKIYDLDASSYFIDPGNTTTSLLVAGNVGVGTTDPKGRFAVGFNGGSDQLITYQPADNQLALQTTLDNQPNNGYGGGANILSLQPVAGRVGIGTTAPGGLLQVGTYSGSVENKGGILIASGTGAGGARRYWIGAAADPDTHNNNMLQISDYVGPGNSTPLMTILGAHAGASTGFVGLGTTAPTGRLTINAPAPDTTPAIRILQNGQTAYGYDFGISTTTGSMNIYGRNNGAQNMLMSMNYISQNVGIGVSPLSTAKFTIEGGGGDQLQFYKPSEDRLAIQTTLNSQPNNAYGGNANNRLLLQPVTGRVGIGTLNPNRSLDISTDAGNDGITFGREDGQDNMQFIQTYIDNHWADRATYASGCCNPLVLQPDVGNVVIGTQPGPTSKLHVQGTAKITGALGTNGWDPLGCGTQIEGTSYHNCLAGHTYIQSDLRVGRWLGLNGYAGLGCGSYGLCVGGAAWSNAAFYDGSDIRTKRNIRPVKDALNKILALEGVNFEFKAEDYPGKNYPTDTQMGFIAQQVEPIVPEVVDIGADGMKAIAYAHITPLLVEAVKEQNQKIQELTQEIEKQKNINNLSNKELETLKSQLLDLKEIVQRLDK